MRWELFAVFGLSASCVASLAQGQPGDQLPDNRRSASHADGLLTKSGMVRFELIHGRIHLDPLRHRKGSQQRARNGQYENITVNVERGIPSLHYVLKTDDQQLTVNIHQARSLRAESWLANAREQAVLIHDPSDDVQFRIRRGDLDDHYDGATLLHVYHADPTGFDRHFGRLIERMLKNASIQSIVNATNRELINSLGDNNLPDLASVYQQIGQLGSSQRSKRLLAERALLAWGTPAIALIRSIPDHNFDAQQRAKLNSIVSRLQSSVADTPASLAMLLTSDVTYWQAIARHLDDRQQNLASTHLKRLGIDTPFDRQPIERIATLPNVTE